MYLGVKVVQFLLFLVIGVSVLSGGAIGIIGGVYYEKFQSADEKQLRLKQLDKLQRITNELD